jgi:3-methyladenine DNA glycosylase AlkD
MDDAARIERDLRAVADTDQVDLIARRVDRSQVIGVRMKYVFDMAKANKKLDLETVRELLRSNWFELRMVAVSILDARARTAPAKTPERTALYDMYLREHAHIDTWDLVDRAAPRVVGDYLLDRSKAPLHRLAQSANPWERRTSIVASYWLIRHGQLDDPLRILDRLVDDPELFVQTAWGTALREVRRVDPEKADRFEHTHADAIHPAARRASRVGRS